jgi:hypothetical protein
MLRNWKQKGNVEETLSDKGLILLIHIGKKKGNFLEIPSGGKKFPSFPPLKGEGGNIPDAIHTLTFNIKSFSPAWSRARSAETATPGESSASRPAPGAVELKARGIKQ